MRLPTPLPVSVDAADIPARVRFRNHCHDTMHLCAVVSGRFTESGRRERTDVVPGTLRVSPAARHDIDFGADGARCLVIEIHAASWQPAPVDRSHFFHDEWLSALVRRLDRQVAADDPVRTLEREGLVLEMMAQVDRRRGRRVSAVPPRWLLRARDAMHDEPGPLSLERLAGALDLNRVHLARAFRRHFGVTVGDYARRIRLTRAWRLLEDPVGSLAQVAAVAGFADQSHMTREMQRAFGTSPGVLRSGSALHRFKTGSEPAS